MATIYVFENFADQPTSTLAQISRPTIQECEKVFADNYDTNDYSWSEAAIADSVSAETL
jgi:hypothetical protein